jgi:outer membrane receptor protein involved in Fe transport
LNGSDVGVYAQTAIAPSDRWELRTGVRFDNHNAPFAGNKSQLSPRVKFTFFPDPGNTVWVYYGRLFVPTNVEDLRAITSSAQGGVATAPTLPERDHFFEIGYVHRFPLGVVTKLSGYYKRSSPGIDDNTVPGSAIVTSVNVGQIRVTGIEAVAEIRPTGPVSGYLNLALNHAYGYGPITGGFFAVQPPTTPHDLDHDQRLSGVASLVYAARRIAPVCSPSTSTPTSRPISSWARARATRWSWEVSSCDHRSMSTTSSTKSMRSKARSSAARR